LPPTDSLRVRQRPDDSTCVIDSFRERLDPEPRGYQRPVVLPASSGSSKIDQSLTLKLFLCTNRDASVMWRRDVFDNKSRLDLYRRHRDISKAKLRLRLDVREGIRSPSCSTHGLSSYRCGTRLTDARAHAHQPPRAASVPTLPFWRAPTGPQAVDTLLAINRALRQPPIRASRGGPARSTAETLALGVAACRDFAVVLVDTLRQLGLAARFASSYLCELGGAEKTRGTARVGRVYLPGAGWLRLDPTNGVLCSRIT
jgi:transglutaminase-like putative cysteine protease